MNARKHSPLSKGPGWVVTTNREYHLMRFACDRQTATEYRDEARHEFSPERRKRLIEYAREWGARARDSFAKALKRAPIGS